MLPAPPRQHLSAGGLSLLVHGAFLALLMLGVSWRNLPQLPVEAELWSALPAIAPPPPLIQPEAPAPAPEKIQPAPEPESAAKPDLALEKAERKRLAEEARQREQQRQEEEARQKEEKRQAEEQALRERKEREERERQDKERLEKERKELARREMEQELARQADEELAAEAKQLDAAWRQRMQKASRVTRLIQDNQERIRTRIKGYLRLPGKLTGNPEVVFRVILMPNGEVLRAELLRGSGQSAYDLEVERAILKASPLPLPPDREAAAAFREPLILKFRPHDGMG